MHYKMHCKNVCIIRMYNKNVLQECITKCIEEFITKMYCKNILQEYIAYKNVLQDCITKMYYNNRVIQLPGANLITYK